MQDCMDITAQKNPGQKSAREYDWNHQIKL